MFLRISHVAAAALLWLSAIAPYRAQQPSYPRSALLVETDWVARHGRDRNVRIVDLRSPEAFRQGHLAGAVPIAEMALRFADDKETYLPRPEAFARLMGAAGIDARTHVIAYDDQDGKAAARLWYVLKAYGHDNVSLVNGGWRKWTAEGRAIETQVAPVAPAVFLPTAVPAISCPSREMLAQKPGVVVLDARSADEWSGATRSPGASRTGRIPGAVNIEWKQALAPDGTFLPAGALRRLFAARGITPDKEIVVHCASGGRAAHTLFVLSLLGYERLRIYYGSFSDYSDRPDAPIESSAPQPAS